jgi:hypothetical protein
VAASDAGTDVVLAHSAPAARVRARPVGGSNSGAGRPAVTAPVPTFPARSRWQTRRWWLAPLVSPVNRAEGPAPAQAGVPLQLAGAAEPVDTTMTVSARPEAASVPGVQDTDSWPSPGDTVTTGFVGATASYRMVSETGAERLPQGSSNQAYTVRSTPLPPSANDLEVAMVNQALQLDDDDDRHAFATPEASEAARDAVTVDDRVQVAPAFRETAAPVGASSSGAGRPVVTRPVATLPAASTAHRRNV